MQGFVVSGNANGQKRVRKTMGVNLDLPVAELLCSRLCHDLIGPLNAVNTGLELLAEEDPGMAGDAVDLARRSAGEVTRRLTFFRAALGRSGTGGRTAPVAQLRELAAGYVGNEGKVAVDWPTRDDGPGELSRDEGRLVLNLFLLAVEALPHGGRVQVALAALDEGVGLAITAEGAKAGIGAEARAALEGHARTETLTARTVHPYFTGRLADSLEADVEITDGGEGRVQLAALLRGSSG